MIAGVEAESRALAWRENDRPVRAWPGPVLTRYVEIIDITGNLTSVSNLRWNRRMDASSPRHLGRPWQMAPYAPHVAQWLREDPNLSGAESPRRIRIAVYRAGKLAFCELVRHLIHPGSA